MSDRPLFRCRFTVRMRHGGLVKVYDSVLMAESQYKSLLVSDRTSVDQLVQLLLTCYKSNESVHNYSLYEVCRTTSFERKLHADDRPLAIQQEWSSLAEYSFVLMKRPPGTPRSGRDFPLRRSVSSAVKAFSGAVGGVPSVLFVRALGGVVSSKSSDISMCIQPSII
ncbi:hypothetical protein FJT64_021983 [Amphibalanus amphitrite]|uniref:Ras-associating domain-containing protein n=1 Tax=Amphibalanus amphitrite TaxID=1232801 RepID=A0A6A4WVZ3_AMPAM|nr:hypothetical protein FJT64_021983 [Amphibalanus amphitrite]